MAISRRSSSILLTFTVISLTLLLPITVTEAKGTSKSGRAGYQGPSEISMDKLIHEIHNTSSLAEAFAAAKLDPSVRFPFKAAGKLFNRRGLLGWRVAARFAKRLYKMVRFWKSSCKTLAEERCATKAREMLSARFKFLNGKVEELQKAGGMNAKATARLSLAAQALAVTKSAFERYEHAATNGGGGGQPEDEEEDE